MSERDTIVNLEEIPPTPQTPGPAERPSISVFRKRLRKFRTIKRGYYSFLILLRRIRDFVSSTDAHQQRSIARAIRR